MAEWVDSPSRLAGKNRVFPARLGRSAPFLEGLEHLFERRPLGVDRRLRPGHLEEPVRVRTLGDGAEESLTATIDVLRVIGTDRGPKHWLVALGYAGWGPGQLDEEMHRHGWHVADASDVLLYDMPVEERWSAAFEAQGIDPRLLAVDSGHA